MATARVALGSVFDTVADVAGTVSSLTNTIASSAHMANDFINAQRVKQQDRIIIDTAQYRNILIEETAQANTLRRENIAKWVNEDPQNRTNLWNESLAELKELFEPKD